MLIDILLFNPIRKYEEALEYHRQALVLIPQNASTYSAIGYIHSLMGNFESAIDYFHTVRMPEVLLTDSVFTISFCFDVGTDGMFYPTPKLLFDFFFFKKSSLVFCALSWTSFLKPLFKTLLVDPFCKPTELCYTMCVLYQLLQLKWFEVIPTCASKKFYSKCRCKSRPLSVVMDLSLRYDNRILLFPGQFWWFHVFIE